MTNSEKVRGLGRCGERGFWLAIVLASCSIDPRDVDTDSAPQLPAAGGSAGSDSALGGSGASELQLEPDGGAGAEGPVDDRVPLVPGSGGPSGADSSMPATTKQVELVLSFSGSGQGAVRVDPPGVSCEDDCTQSYPLDTRVTLTPAPEAGAAFVGWVSEPCMGAGTDPCQFSARSDVAITAQFDAVPPQQLSVVLGGDGRITSSPSGIDCPGTCSATFPGGTSVVLSATRSEGTGEYFEGWTGSCSGFDACSVRLDLARSVGASFGPANLVFVTSTLTLPGSFGGLAGADEICRQRAAAGGLEGRFVAFLSTSAVSAEQRLTGARGWVRSDGLEVADAPSGLTKYEIFHPIRLDEFGTDALESLVVTGTTAQGVTLVDGTCNDWTDPTLNFGYGSTNNIGAFFLSGGINLCNVQASALYCFQVDRRVRVVPRRFSGRLAFTTDDVFQPGGGLASADALCQREASAAGLPGTYRAELATSTAPPEARFDLSGPPWVRPDGVLLELTAAAYFSAQYTRSAPIVTAAGKYDGFGRNWLGFTNARTSSAETTCEDWTSETLTTGIVSTVANTDNPGSAFRGSSCGLALPIICLQE